MFELNAPFIVGTLFAIFCGRMFAHAWRSYKNSIESKYWPSVEGKISNVELWGKRNVSGEIKEVENLKIEYIFEVHGKTYKGTTAAFYTLVYPETVDFACVHPTNSKVSVYYKANNPDESVLMPGPKSGNKRYSDIILASVGIGVSVSIAFFGAIGIIG
jgi:hypothetical protein